MIVVLRHKIEMVHQAHRFLQSWMKQRTRKNGGRLFLRFLQAVQQLPACCTKVAKDLLHGACVVVGFMSFSIAQVRGS